MGTISKGLVWGLASFLATAGVAEARAKSTLTATGVVNLNQATAAQLDQLPGVGEKAAKRIIEYRQKTPFAKAEELMKVKGFGKKKFEKLKPHLATAGPTTLKVSRGGAPASAQGRTAPLLH